MKIKPYHMNFTTMLMLGHPRHPPFSSAHSLPWGAGWFSKDPEAMYRILNTGRKGLNEVNMMCNNPFWSSVKVQRELWHLVLQKQLMIYRKLNVKNPTRLPLKIVCANEVKNHSTSGFCSSVRLVTFACLPIFFSPRSRCNLSCWNFMFYSQVQLS